MYKVIDAITEKQFSRNAKLFVVFVDFFYKEFHTVSHTMWWLVLSRTGIRGKMLNMLRNMYVSIKACVRCSGGARSRTSLNAFRARSKAACSARFSYFTNELANGITRGGSHGIQLLPNQIEIFLMLFADDLALLSSNSHGAAEPVDFTL